jgi:hypothetical protein
MKASSREEENWVNIENIASFPCKDLRTIDQLWVHYSDGKFGFSVQGKIFLEYCNISNYEESAYKLFAAKVGCYNPSKDYWRTYDEFMLGTNNAQTACLGSLPYFGLGAVGDSKAYTNAQLAKRDEWSLPWKAFGKVVDTFGVVPGLATFGWLLYDGSGKAPSIFRQDTDIREAYRMTSTILRRFMDCNK